MAGLLCIALIAGCVSAPPGTAGSPTPAPLRTSPDLHTVIETFDTYAEQTFQRSATPGMAVAIVKDDRIVYLRPFGVKNITTQEPVGPDTRFQLASISKSFTSATIASMVGTGELSWDDRVATINTDFRLLDPWVTEHVTFRDLLSHRTGLPEYTGDVLQDTFAYNRSEILGKLRYVQPATEFRSGYAYMNADITAAAVAASLREGTPWEDLIVERVFVPAGMHNTSARFADFAGSPDHADTYPTADGKAVSGPLLNDDVNSPAGGVSSTIRDMARYARLQLNNGSIDGTQVIAADALKETHRPHIIAEYTDTGITAYDLGWKTIAEDGHIRIEHGGDLSSGVSTYITLYPSENMAIVVLTNSFPDGAVLKRAVNKGWDDLYFKGAVQEDWYTIIDQKFKELMKPGASVLMPKEPLTGPPVSAQLPRSLDAYTGLFTQDYYGDIRIAKNETGLFVWPGHSTTPFFLEPYEGDMFRETVENTAVWFTAGNDGKITAVRFDMFDLPGRSGTFVRKKP